MKKHSIARDQRRRKLFTNKELRRRVLKSLIHNRSMSDPKERSLYAGRLNMFPKDSSSVRVKNRCVLTGRSRGVLSFFRLSRISFRKLASFGYIPGVSKSSW